MSYYTSDIFPLKVGTKWVYSFGGKMFNRDIKAEVVDKKSNLYLIKFTMGNAEGSLVLKSNVDLSITAYSRKGLDSMEDESDFEIIPDIVILKSPVVSGTMWENDYGQFNVINSNYKLKLGSKVFPDCIYLQFRDTSNAYNDIYIKEGVGIIYAFIFIDGFGKVSVGLKKFN